MNVFYVWCIAFIPDNEKPDIDRERLYQDLLKE
jgi:hypothetical protein